MHRGMSWLVEAQHESGGWGGGSHANQSQLDPHSIQTDPVTTAFAAMALLRTGHTTSSGDYQKTSSARRSICWTLSSLRRRKARKLPTSLGRSRKRNLVRLWIRP